MEISNNTPVINNNIPTSELNDFKIILSEWLKIDKEITDREKIIKDIKKKRNKELEPKIISFMREYNLTNLTTESCKLKCVERNTTEPLNKTNIRDNLSKLLSDELLVDKAMDGILNNRDKKVSYKLTKHK
jgi:hypothetical protein